MPAPPPASSSRRSPQPLQRLRRAAAKACKVRLALLLERSQALLRLLRALELVQAAERKRPLRRQVLGVLVERLLEEAKRRRRQREDLIRVAAHLRAQLLRRDDAVDEAPALSLPRVVLAAQEPDLSRALLPHHARQIARAEARVDGAYARARLPAAGMLRRDRKLARA